MKKIIILLSTIIVLILGALFFNCEPIGVSVNSKGDIAFTREEGVFYYNAKNKKVTQLLWNYGKKIIPVLVKWSPDGKTLAYTTKSDASTTEANIYLTSNSKKPSLLATVKKVTTRLEWSPKKGDTLSIAMAGEDSDMGVADLALVDVKSGSVDVVLKNVGDVHKWTENNKIAIVKISEKNKDDSSMYKGAIGVYDVASKTFTPLANMITKTSGAVEYSPKNKIIYFTAINASKEDVAFDKDKKDVHLYMIDVKGKKLIQYSDAVINYLKFSPDYSKLLIKIQEGDKYNPTYGLSFIDVKSGKLTTLTHNIVDTISSNSASVKVCPNWENNNTALFWKNRTVYAADGTALTLLSINLKNNKITNYQVLIDPIIDQLVQKNGGY